MSRQTLRGFRKEMLILQAAQHRASLRAALYDLSPSSASVEKENAAWLASAGSVLGAVLPPKWGRWVNLALNSWRVGKRVLAARDQVSSDFTGPL